MVDFAERFALYRAQRDYQAIIAAIPYAHFMGVCFELDARDCLRFSLPYRERNIGNTALPALHGGLIGGFLENAALIHLMWFQALRGIPKIVDFSIDFLRPGRPQTLMAGCEITRHGKRVAHVLMQAWQDSQDKPVAIARAHFLLPAAGD